MTRPFIGRFADRVGYRRVFLPCVVLIVVAFALLTVGGSRPFLIASALLFGTGFGSAYPVFLAHVLRYVDESRRGATFGSIIGAFDTGIGTGSIVMGWIIEHFGFRPAWATAAALATHGDPVLPGRRAHVCCSRMKAQLLEQAVSPVVGTAKGEARVARPFRELEPVTWTSLAPAPNLSASPDSRGREPAGRDVRP